MGRYRGIKPRKRRRQVTCLCYRYSFPHRLGGGRCFGRDWAQSYYEIDRYQCDACISNTGTGCEVALGQEAIRHCGGARDHHRDWPTERRRFPPIERELTIEDDPDFEIYAETLDVPIISLIK